MTNQNIAASQGGINAQRTSMRWFRMYAEFATDPKVQMLSEADQRRFLMLLCLRCGNGDVTLHDAECAFQMRISDDEFAQTKAVLVARGLIDTDNKPIAWERRQYVSNTSKHRVSRYRERKRSSHVTACNVTVTTPESESDTEKEKKEHCAVQPSRATAPRFPSTEEIDGRFEEFWRAFPSGRKRGKGKAKIVFRLIARGGHHTLKANPDVLIDAAKAYAATKPAPQFTPMPLTWLNQGRWDDDLSDGAKPAPPKEAKPFDWSTAPAWMREEHELMKGAH